MRRIIHADANDIVRPRHRGTDPQRLSPFKQWQLAIGDGGTQPRDTVASQKRTVNGAGNGARVVAALNTLRISGNDNRDFATRLA